MHKPRNGDSLQLFPALGLRLAFWVLEECFFFNYCHILSPHLTLSDICGKPSLNELGSRPCRWSEVANPSTKDNLKSITSDHDESETLHAMAAIYPLSWVMKHSCFKKWPQTRTVLPHSEAGDPWCFRDLVQKCSYWFDYFFLLQNPKLLLYDICWGFCTKQDYSISFIFLDVYLICKAFKHVIGLFLFFKTGYSVAAGEFTGDSQQGERHCRM